MLGSADYSVMRGSSVGSCHLGHNGYPGDRVMSDCALLARTFLYLLSSLTKEME
jgi:hypothetical protein